MIRVGTSGYNYPEWRGSFYPEKFPTSRMLAYYAERFSTVEINYTFYRMPTAKTIAGWVAETPEHFSFTLKAPQRITHIARLRDIADPLRYFLDTAAGLGPKLGPVLFQLPPTYSADLAVLRRFLNELPPNHRWVVEFRHPSWHMAEVYETLADHAVALCIPVGGRVRPELVTTAPFVYIRMHAGEGPGGGFTTEQLAYWAGRLRALGKAGKDRFVIIDAVGVTESRKTATQPLERCPSVKFDKLIDQVAAGDRRDDTLVTLATRLTTLGVRAAALHADRTQQQRMSAVEGFRTGTYPVLVATDVAARGLDIEGIAHVVNFEVPDTPEAYVHRVGRTGRAEATGTAVTLVAPEERGTMRAIERALKLRTEANVA